MNDDRYNDDSTADLLDRLARRDAEIARLQAEVDNLLKLLRDMETQVMAMVANVYNARPDATTTLVRRRTNPNEWGHLLKSRFGSRF